MGNFSFPFGRFRKPSTIFKFHKLSHTFKFLCIFNFHELSQTFSDFLSIFHYFSWFRTFAAWSEGPFSQVFHNESSHDRQGRSLNVFLCFRAVSSWVLLRSLDHVLRQGCYCIYLKNLTQGVLPKGAIPVAVEAKTYAYHPALYTSCTVDVANFMSGLQEEVSSLKAIFG